MCVAIVKPAGFSIDEEILRRCWQGNKDGCGIAYIQHGKGKKTKVKNKLMLYRSMGFTKFLAELRKVEKKYPKYPMLIHFRASSKGGVTLDNCHPFAIDKNHAFIHNGTISKVKDDPKKEKSDTRMFNEEIMSKLPKGWFGNPACQELIEDYIGQSKLAMLNIDGDVQIFNKSKGDTSTDGVWFSNTQWRTTISPAANKGGNTGSVKDWRNNWNEDDDQNYDRNRYNNLDSDAGLDTHKDMTRYCDKNKAYHGQDRVHNGVEYQKFDYFDLKWIRLCDWKEKYLSGKTVPKVTTLTADDMPDDPSHITEGNIYDIEPPQIHSICMALGIPVQRQTFEMKLTDDEGMDDLIKFKRCSHCWTPDYEYLIKDIVIEGEVVELCDECEHEMKLSGMLCDEKGGK
jgi:hypothetical protein